MKNEANPKVTLAEVVAARARLNGAVHVTQCTESAALSELTGARIFCKQEFSPADGELQGARGAECAGATVAGTVALGVIAASAGNHALGLAWHGRALGVPVTVVMPRFAPLVKVARCRQFGASVVLHGDTFDEARSEANRLAAERRLTYIHPFDDPQVIAGQGTLAFEILEQVPDADAVLVPVGGGGLLAGVATVWHALTPGLQVIGVEPANAACFAAGLAAGAPVRVPTKFTLADGLAVAEAGQNALAIAAPLVQRLVQVSEEELALAILRLAELEKCIIEGAGAAGTGGVAERASAGAQGQEGGAAVDGREHRSAGAQPGWVERGLAADGRIYRFDVLLNDRPGSLAHLSSVLADAGVNVTGASCITGLSRGRTFRGCMCCARWRQGTGAYRFAKPAAGGERRGVGP